MLNWKWSAALLFAAGLVVVGNVHADTYVGVKPGYRWDGHSYVKIVAVADTVIVPVPVPGTLLLNLAPGEAPPPVTYSQKAIDAMRQQGDDRVAQMEAALARLEKLIIQQRQSQTAPDDLPPIPQEVKADVRPRADPSLETRVPAILKAHCAQCHTGVNSRGGFALFDAAGNFDLAREERESVWRSVEHNKMPKGPVKLNPADKAAVKAWAQGG